MRSRLWCLAVVLLWLSAGANVIAAESGDPVDFIQVVISKAISFMPDEQKSKLGEVEKSILTSARAYAKKSAELAYFVDKKEGTGPAALAEHFRAVRKGVVEKSSYPTLAPAIGKLTASVISLSQPYHTDEAAFKGEAHPAFEKQLDAACASLKVDFDGYNSVDDPYEFGIQLAKRANEHLKKTTPAEGENTSEIQSAVFALAANSVADCWWTLLVGAGDSSHSDEAGNYIGNKRSLKFHLPTCRYQPAQKNQVHFQTREDAIKEGYVPCKVRKP